MKRLLTLSLILTSFSSFAETKIVCSNQEVIFNPKNGFIEGRPIADSANAVNAHIKALEDQGKKVKVVQQSIAYGGFQAVAAGVNNNFINSKAVQYPTICVTLEIE